MSNSSILILSASPVLVHTVDNRYKTNRSASKTSAMNQLQPSSWTALITSNDDSEDELNILPDLSQSRRSTSTKLLSGRQSIMKPLTARHASSSSGPQQQLMTSYFAIQAHSSPNSIPVISSDPPSSSNFQIPIKHRSTPSSVSRPASPSTSVISISPEPTEVPHLLHSNPNTKQFLSLADALNNTFQQNSQASGKPSLSTSRPLVPLPSRARQIPPKKLNEGTTSRNGRELRQTVARIDATAATRETNDIIDSRLETQELPVLFRRTASVHAPELYAAQEATMQRQIERWLADPSGTAHGSAKGKEREQPQWKGYTMPRYSEAGLYKRRLDELLGPGDMLRGLGKPPTAQRPLADKESDMDVEMDDAQGETTDGETTKFDTIRRRRQIEEGGERVSVLRLEEGM
ncbi:hypothetical protein BDW22DRAFT_1351296 [Trametopsis cervina]|nr:hypothetical protein BDW22DRAFT_1351296 [Trametopsis cervina]